MDIILRSHRLDSFNGFRREQLRQHFGVGQFLVGFAFGGFLLVIGF